MTVTYELLEEFTGTRSTEMPDPDNEEATITADSACRDIKVKFTCDTSGCIHERSVNVCFAEDAVTYDHEATLVRVGEVGMGVAHKMDCGVISMPAAEEAA